MHQNQKESKTGIQDCLMISPSILEDHNIAVSLYYYSGSVVLMFELPNRCRIHNLYFIINEFRIFQRL